VELHIESNNPSTVSNILYQLMRTLEPNPIQAKKGDRIRTALRSLVLGLLRGRFPKPGSQNVNSARFRFTTGPSSRWIVKLIRMLIPQCGFIKKGKLRRSVQSVS
jgi:hypothetical protein